MLAILRDEQYGLWPLRDRLYCQRQCRRVDVQSEYQWRKRHDDELKHCYGRGDDVVNHVQNLPLIS